MNQIEASDQWNYYQAKSIKASVLDAKMSLAGAPDESDQSSATAMRKNRKKSNRKPSTRKPRRNQTFTSTKCSRAA